jgi:Spy/CpxP family protein refolding chaperone
MNRLRSAALAALMVAVATPAFAQQGDSLRAKRGERGERGERGRMEMRERFGARGMGAGGVESLLRMRETLKLSDAQVNQLEAMRKEIVAQRQNQARDMIDLQSRIAAGQVEREEARKQLETRRETLRTTMEQRRERMENILTAEQREQLQQARQRMERMERRPMRAPRGRGGFDGPPPRGRYRWN